jgi:transcriptional regulator with PAS, ATPase and Fis domain
MLRKIVADARLLEIRIDPRAEEVLRNYDWPGNVRELSNVLERVSCSLEKDTIHPRDLPFYLHGKPANSVEADRSSLKDVKSASEKEAIRHALAATSNNKARAADLLGIHRTLLYKKMRRYGLSLD